MLLLRTLTLCLLLFTGLSAQSEQAAMTKAAGISDPREHVNPSSPDWVYAVGRLTVPSHRFVDGERRAYLEHCTATLIALPGDRRQHYIGSAWHCLENYRDRSQAIIFEAVSRSGERFQRRAFQLRSGGDMSQDWALLKLDQAVPDTDITALTVLDSRLDSLDPGDVLSMAGFSRDSGMGAGGKRLSYHRDCQLLPSTRINRLTNCVAYKGASGGPVIVERGGDSLFAGVISEGSGGDSSYFYPSHRFYPLLY